MNTLGLKNGPNFTSVINEAAHSSLWWIVPWIKNHLFFQNGEHYCWRVEKTKQSLKRWNTEFIQWRQCFYSRYKEPLKAWHFPFLIRSFKKGREGLTKKTRTQRHLCWSLFFFSLYEKGREVDDRRLTKKAFKKEKGLRKITRTQWHLCCLLLWSLFFFSLYEKGREVDDRRLMKKAFKKEKTIMT